MGLNLPIDAIQEADIVDLAHDGRGIARINGKAVFVAGALPGERVRLRVFKRRRQMDEAGLVDVLIASPDRVTPVCAHFGVCGGCSLQHMAPAAQLAAKQRQLLDSLERIGRVNPETVLPAVCGPHWAYRRRARIGVKYVHKKARVLAGFREREKPYIADVQRCEILSEPFAMLPRDLAALVETLSIREQIPQVEVAVGDQERALVFRVMAAPDAADLEKLAAFGEKLGAQIFLQSAGLDSIRPLRSSYPPLRYRLGATPTTIEFGPVDFIQINREINFALVAAAESLLQPTPKDVILDLFCGLGNFTLPLARRCLEAVGVEGDAGLVQKAGINAAQNGINNASFYTDNLFEPVSCGNWVTQRYDLVLLDPPRAGAMEILGHMSQWRPRRVVYISCHPGSLARDAGILVGNHGFKLLGAGVMDMFPHTAHVESIAVFEAGA